MSDIFLDTANVNEIKEIMKWNIVDGVTTNQKIFLKEKGCNFEKRAKEILELVYPLPVSLEGPNNLNDLMKVALKYADWVDDRDNTYNNIVIKVPMLGNGDGLKAVKILSEKGIKTNVTACMTLNQTFLAASAGATYVSLFYNRMIDWAVKQIKNPKAKSSSGEEEVGKQYAINTIIGTMNMLSTGRYDTELIVGSIRNVDDIHTIVSTGADIITIPTHILKQMPHNDMTEKTLKDFEEAWKEFCKYESK